MITAPMITSTRENDVRYTRLADKFEAGGWNRLPGGGCLQGPARNARSSLQRFATPDLPDYCELLADRRATYAGSAATRGTFYCETFF